MSRRFMRQIDGIFFVNGTLSYRPLVCLPSISTFPQSTFSHLSATALFSFGHSPTSATTRTRRCGAMSSKVQDSIARRVGWKSHLLKPSRRSPCPIPSSQPQMKTISSSSVSAPFSAQNLLSSSNQAPASRFITQPGLLRAFVRLCCVDHQSKASGSFMARSSTTRLTSHRLSIGLFLSGSQCRS